MIWESVLIMTIIDLIIIVLALFVFLTFHKNRQTLKHLKIQRRVALILTGFLVMALLYFIDILTMHLFPKLMPMKKAMEIMTDLHLNYSWILSAIGFSLLGLGIVYLNKTLFPKILSYQKELEEISITDQLTELLNRRGFITMAEKQCEIATRNKLNLSFLFIDIDSMKSINDNYGHQEGDSALVDAANILKKSFRGSDIISRIGGDEFMVMVMETPETDIEALTKRLKLNLKAHADQSRKPYKLSLSLGLTRYSYDSPCSIDELMIKADKAMYEQKKR